jgi:flavin reductase (DIM6/NTAB) family NADH-FMN oxidoreductase RutF
VRAVDVAATLNRWVGNIDYPMLIVTVKGGDERAGCLVGFATQSSIRPLRFLVCLSDKNHTYRVAQTADVVGVHLVPADRDGLARLFGEQTGDEVDKFAQCAWHEGPERTPLLDDCPDWFVGHVLQRLDAGDHQALLLEPFAAGAGPATTQFDFHRAKRFQPGHEA